MHTNTNNVTLLTFIKSFNDVSNWECYLDNKSIRAWFKVLVRLQGATFSTHKRKQQVPQDFGKCAHCDIQRQLDATRIAFS